MTSSNIFAKKSVADLQADPSEKQILKRSLSLTDLVFLGVGCMVGTGVFVLTGQVAAHNAGPGVMISFALAAVAAALAALCYAEMASMIAIAGSAYTYAYATMGEVFAFMIGWNLVLEYTVSASMVSSGWSAYAVNFLHRFLAIDLPTEWTSTPFAWDAAQFTFHYTGAYLNLPAFLILILISWIMARGVQFSASLNAVIVSIKIAVILSFILGGMWFVNTANWSPLIPPNEGDFGKFGFSGIFQGATLVFFAFGGFDSLSTASLEAKNPRRDIPLAIMISLLIATALYMAVAAVLTGIVPYSELGVSHPLAVGIAATGMKWLELAISIGAVAGLTSVMLLQLYAQTRIFLAMSQDGLFPRFASEIHPKHQTPAKITWATGLVMAAGGALFPIEILGELTSIGILTAFWMVSLAVVILRYTHPELPRPFRAPGGTYLVPVLSILCSSALIYTSTWANLLRLLVWMALGVVVYFSYGRKNSKLGNPTR